MKKNQYLPKNSRPGLFFYLLTVIVLSVFLCGPQKTSAAQKGVPSKKVLFTDGSGSYLKSGKSGWFLYDRNNKPLTGIQYLKIPGTGVYHSGFYMFDSRGKLLNRNGVYYIQKKEIHGVHFHGYYYTNRNGRLESHFGGLRYLPGLSCGKNTYQGYYYVEAYGHIADHEQLIRLKKITVNKTTFPTGYYWITRKGQLSTKKIFRSLDTSIGKKKWKGTYYFGGIQGALYTKKGWVTIGSETYYIYQSGKRAQSRWISDHYVLSDGRMAKSRKVPGGYVNSSGKRCSEGDLEMEPLKKTLTRMISGYGGSWSVYVKDLKTGGMISINDTAMYPASTIKAFVMASTYDQIKKGNLRQTDTINRLLRNMITVSDNESCNELVRYNSSSHSFAGGCGTVNAFLIANGYQKTRIHHTLHPASSARASDGGGSNLASAQDAGNLLEKIYRGTCVSKTCSKEMLNLLLQQQRRWKIPAGLPAGVKSANKTGETSTYEHDIAIVYGKKTDYIICVFSHYGAISNIRQISGAVYQALNK